MGEAATSPDWVLAPGVRRVESGRVLIGGSPTTIMRLTVAGAVVLDRALTTSDEPVSAATGALLARLERRGMLVATPAPLSPDRVWGLLEGLTVVVPVRDDADGVAALLESLVASVPPPPGHTGTDPNRLAMRTLVVDDGSADAQAVVAAADRFGAEVIRRDRSGGPGVARMSGLDAVTTPWVAFLDADTTVTPSWLVTLGAHLDADLTSGDGGGDGSKLALVAPRVGARPGGRSGEPRLWASKVPKLGTSHAHNDAERERGPAARMPGGLAAYEQRKSPLDLGADGGAIAPGTRLAYAPSAAWLARVDALRHVGGFDPSLRYGEDVDLVWRLVDAGWIARYEPRSRVEHLTRETLGAWAEQRFRYGTSAAPLAVRHPGALAPVVTSPWSAAAWGLVAFGHPFAGATVATGATLALARRLNVAHPTAEAFRLAGRGTLLAGPQLARALIRPWWPVTLVAAVGGGRRGRALAAVAVTASALHGRSMWAVVDDGAYGAGVWWGLAKQVRRRPSSASAALEAVLPRFGGRRARSGGGVVKRLRSAIGRGE